MAKKVLVGMSGGVDSAAAALLLQRAGYEVSGVTMRLHERCTITGEQDIADARAVAAHMGIEHFVLDFDEIFRREVMERFVAEYCAGRTPNPCIDCNRSIKFGAMLDWALEQGFDALATGHYASVREDEATARHLLLRGRDRAKDQSYFLYSLTPAQLSGVLLPLGEYDKPQVRALAEEAGFVNARRRDSQDICFVPGGDYVSFLEDFGAVTLTPGDFVDAAGRVLGRHRGLAAYTAGQRKGLGVSADRPLYVISKNAADNTVLLGDDRDLFSAELTACRVNWIVPPPTGELRCTAKTRYSQKECTATVTVLEDRRVRVVFDEPQRAVTAGQAVVFYLGEVVAGGGTIEER